MKKSIKILVTIPFALFILSSCKKTYVCECTVVYIEIPSNVTSTEIENYTYSEKKEKEAVKKCDAVEYSQTTPYYTVTSTCKLK